MVDVNRSDERLQVEVCGLLPRGFNARARSHAQKQSMKEMFYFRRGEMQIAKHV